MVQENVLCASGNQIVNMDNLALWRAIDSAYKLVVLLD